MTIEIPLSKTGKHAGKHVAIVDDEDVILAEQNWTISTPGYARRGSHRQHIYLHVAVMERMTGQGSKDGYEIDHINRNRLDNRRENLRWATVSQQRMNATVSKHTKTGVRGIGIDGKSGKYRVRIHRDGKCRYDKKFSFFEDAVKAHDEKSKEIFGDYSPISQP